MPTASADSLPRGPLAPRAHDVVVVGGGHAGIEAALAARRLGARVALVSLRLDKVGEMSCNPAIGGLGKGQIVREVDALGGVMARVADSTGIQFRMLNTGKGAAVRAPRCQSDRHRYRATATEAVREAGVELIEGAVEGLVLGRGGSGPRVTGVRLADGRELAAGAVVVTTGTFLRAVMHTGETQADGGRVGEGATGGISADLVGLGLVLGRLKTGTPPRLAREGIRWDELEPQPGDEHPVPFSAWTDLATFPELEQRPCHLTWTNATAHEIIRANLHRSPMFSGRISGVGPRYCPSIEDKVVRFADKDRHQVFLEPEGLDTDVIYVNGVSTSLPADAQEAFVRAIDGLEQARFLLHGYAVEYDFVQPSQLDDTLRVRAANGLWLAGQINGTSGYEEAAGQGLIAGANAALWVAGSAPFVLRRHEAYVGVMVDDLVVSNPTEPYRMFTSRAEHRLLLRQDNAEERLVRRAHAVGLACDEALARLEAFEAQKSAGRDVLDRQRSKEHGGRTLTEVLRRPGVSFADLACTNEALAALELAPRVAESLEIDIKYAGYVEREHERVERLRRQQEVEIPAELDYASMTGLATEAKERLAELRPRTLGAAARIAGVRPPDVALLAVHVERFKRTREARRKDASSESS